MTDLYQSQPVELRRYAALLWKWAWLILLGALIAGGIAYLVSARQSPVYRATAVLLVSGNTNEIVDDYRAILAAENLIPTYAKQLTGRSVQRAVMETLGLTQWTSKVSTEPIADTQLLILNVEDSNPELARDIANLIPTIFVSQDAAIQRQRLATAEETISEQLAATQTSIDAAATALDTLKTSSNPDEAELERIKNELYEYQAAHATFTRQYQEIQLAQAQLFDPLLISEAAELPSTPIGPRVMQNTLLATAVGAMLSIGIIFLIEYMDNTIKTPDDIEHILGISAIGTIPAQDNGEKGVVSHTQPRAPAAEAYRILRTNIQLRTLDAPARSILVTSGRSGEGKTTVAANLATVIAQAGYTVILVGTDLRRASLRRVFDVPNIYGVTTALLDGETAVTHYLQSVGIKNLRLLTSGQLPPNPSELLGSQQMKHLIAALQAEVDFVIFDSPPFLVAADAAVLANAVEGVLLVVSAGETRPSEVARIARSLDEIGARLLGVTLTKYQPQPTDSHYYYGSSRTSA